AAMDRSAPAAARARGKRREMRVIVAAHQQVSEARAGRATHPRKRPAIPWAIVPLEPAKIRSMELPASTVQIRRATDVLTNRSKRSATPLLTITTAAHRSATPLLTI